MDPNNRNTIRPHILRLNTSGGDCKKQITTSFAEFFQRARILPEGKSVSFEWNKEYFPVKVYTASEIENMNWEDFHVDDIEDVDEETYREWAQRANRQ